MKSSSISPIFANSFMGEPIAINTKIQVETEQGIGLMTYRGILIDFDDYMCYIGINEQEVNTAIKWEEIASIELLDLEAEEKMELMNKEPASGAVS